MKETFAVYILEGICCLVTSQGTPIVKKVYYKVFVS